MVDTISENGLTLAFTKTTEEHLPVHYIFNKEAPPPECLGEPFINKEAINLLAPNVKHIASKEYLLSLAMMTVSKDSQGSKILTQKMSGRTTVVRHGLIEYADNIGSIVIEKGGWLSGEKFVDGCNNSRIDKDMTPWGLYGSKESLNDIKLSTALVKNGFRAALSIGFIPLNPDKTRDWLLSKFEGNLKMKDAIDKSFLIVKDNGDIPVLDFRVGGVERRIDDYNSKSDISVSRGFLAHSARLIKEEMSKYPKKYKDALSKSENLDNYLLVLDKVGKRVPLNEKELVLYFDIYMAIGRNNKSSLEKFLRRRSWLDIGINDSFATYITQSKDIDFAGFTYDFEQAKITESRRDGLDLRDQKELSKEYSINWFNFLDNWSDRVGSYILGGPRIDISWFRNNMI